MHASLVILLFTALAHWATYWAFTRSDRRTDRSVRPRLRPTVCQTSRTDCSRTAHM